MMLGGDLKEYERGVLRESQIFGTSSGMILVLLRD